VNSDGAELQTSSAYYRLFISAFTRAAEDGPSAVRVLRRLLARRPASDSLVGKRLRR